MMSFACFVNPQWNFGFDFFMLIQSHFVSDFSLDCLTTQKRIEENITSFEFPASYISLTKIDWLYNSVFFI